MVSETIQKILLTTIGGFVISGVLLGLRTSAVKTAYDNAGAYNVTSSDGVVHTISASGLSGDTTGMLYGLAASLVMLAVVIVDVMLVLKMIKAKG